MKFTASTMLLASLLVWLHSSTSALATNHSPTPSPEESTTPVEPWRPGPVILSSHRTTMGEQVHTTDVEEVMQESTSTIVSTTPPPAETTISNNTYSEFIDVFCFLGLFIPVIYLCQARLRKFILYMLSIVIPVICATYICLRQWRMVKSFARTQALELTDYLQSVSPTSSLSSSTTSGFLVLIIAGLLAREWGLFHAINQVFSRTLTSLRSAMSPVHSPSIAITNSSLYILYFCLFLQQLVEGEFPLHTISFCHTQLYSCT